MTFTTRLALSAPASPTFSQLDRHDRDHHRLPPDQNPLTRLDAVNPVLPPALIGGFIGGILLYWIAIHRMVGRPPLMSLLSTSSVNLVLIGIGTAVWGTVLFNVSVSVPGLSFGRYTFPGAHIVAAVWRP